MFTTEGKAHVEVLASGYFTAWSTALGQTTIDRLTLSATDERSLRAAAAQMGLTDSQKSDKAFTLLADTIRVGIDKGYLRKEAFADLHEQVWEQAMVSALN
jgi:hypothetical protein